MRVTVESSRLYLGASHSSHRIVTGQKKGSQSSFDFARNLSKDISTNCTMTTRPEKLAAVPEGGLDTKKPIEISIELNETTNKEKERPKKRPSSLNPAITTTITNPTIATTITMGDASSRATTCTGTSTSTGASRTTENKNEEGTNLSTDPPSIANNSPLANAAGEFLPRDASSRTNLGRSGSTLRSGWTVEEEKELVSVVETLGNNSWAEIAANVPGRKANQCSNKWWQMSKKAATTTKSAWTVEEENKLVYVVETFGTSSWTKVAVNVPGRNETQCSNKWRRISKMAATSSGAWTVEEEKKLASAVETFGNTSWAKVAANIPGRNESQCSRKWQYMSKKAATTSSGAWTVEEEKKLVSAVETFGTNSWVKIAANVPGRNDYQCCSKWQTIYKKVAATSSGAWTVDEEKKLVSAVVAFGNTSWAKIAANVPGRNDYQCSRKWQYMSKKAATTSSGAWTVEEENKLLSAVDTFGTTSWTKVAANVPGRNDRQCSRKWQNMSKKDVGDNIPSEETITDGWSLGDEPPGKRRRFEWR
jgi:hypothetical protein